MKTKLILFIAGLVLIISFATISCTNSNKKSDETTNKSEHKEMVQYTCSMHPDVIEDEPGNCPKCGMELIEKGNSGHEEHSHDSGTEHTH